MELTLNELLAGKACRIKNKEYFPTAAYVEPFLERAQRLTSELRIQVQLPNQITYTSSGDINTEDITYNRVLIEAIPFTQSAALLASITRSATFVYQLTSSPLPVLDKVHDFPFSLLIVTEVICSLSKE